MKTTLVVPSVRAHSLERFLAAWEGVGDWDEVIVVEDNPAKTFDVGAAVHYSWAEIDATLGGDSWVISRRDSAIRSFGFLMAHRGGADVVLTLDDDCYPYDRTPICRAHLDRLAMTPRWCESVPGVRTRGLPYRNRGLLHGVVASMGLWSKVADLDSVQALSRLDATARHFEPPRGSRVIPRGQYFPLCGMNFCFTREVAPLAYFPLMGRDSPYARFDDIWFGVAFKKVLDHLGLSVSVGEPFVEHQRASDPFVNLVKEAPGVAANEWLWEAVDAAPLSERTPKGCMAELGEYLGGHEDPYVGKMGRAMGVWAGLFD